MGTGQGGEEGDAGEQQQEVKRRELAVGEKGLVLVRGGSGRALLEVRVAKSHDGCRVSQVRLTNEHLFEVLYPCLWGHYFLN